MPWVEYENPACTSDVILERTLNGYPEVLLIKRGEEPYKEMWALPGGHINFKKETTEETAKRELEEETSLVVNLKHLKLLGVYSDPDRDPRGHYVSHVYYTTRFEGELEARDDAKEARWFRLDSSPKLAFDHGKILNDYREVRGK